MTPSGATDVLSLQELAELDLCNLEQVVLSSCWSADNFILPRRVILLRAARAARSRTLWRLPSEDTILERLARDLEHMTAKLGPFIQEENAVVGQRHVAWHRHVAFTD